MRRGMLFRTFHDGFSVVVGLVGHGLEQQNFLRSTIGDFLQMISLPFYINNRARPP